MKSAPPRESSLTDILVRKALSSSSSSEFVSLYLINLYVCFLVFHFFFPNRISCSMFPFPRRYGGSSNTCWAFLHLPWMARHQSSRYYHQTGPSEKSMCLFLLTIWFVNELFVLERHDFSFYQNRDMTLNGLFRIRMSGVYWFLYELLFLYRHDWWDSIFIICFDSFDVTILFNQFGKVTIHLIWCWLDKYFIHFNAR